MIQMSLSVFTWWKTGRNALQCVLEHFPSFNWSAEVIHRSFVNKQKCTDEFGDNTNINLFSVVVNSFGHSSDMPRGFVCQNWSWRKIMMFQKEVYSNYLVSVDNELFASESADDLQYLLGKFNQVREECLWE